MIKRFVILTLYGYRRLISPLIPPRCRFDPTCSRYAIHAIEHHGLRRGGMMALKRLLRCHPMGDWGYDPVPDHVMKNSPKKKLESAKPSYMRPT